MPMDGSQSSLSPSALYNNGGTTIGWRRWTFALLVLSTALVLIGLMASSLSGHTFDALDLLMLTAFAMTLPWSVIGFWNSLAGFAVMRFAKDPIALVSPFARRIRGDEPIVAKTAILVCVRNEDAGRLQRNVAAMRDGLAATGFADRFHIFILSDTNRPEVAAAEERVAAALQAQPGRPIGITYRRRPSNPGFKAGNIQDFCGRWGGEHEFAIVLDADSVMSPEAMLRLIRIMQVNDRLGIVQTLVTGMPSSSAFARIFQFGMRLGMRSYTLGGALWQADCGPFWGHNAILRLAPFTAYCHLPILPGKPPLGGYVLSHDQVEAVLMRRAGYEVRVLPEEDGSWEENPPTLLEFIRRDLRWCQGNMQYWRLLALPGLRPISRVQLMLAILMYLGAPGWLTFMGVGLARANLADPGFILFRSDSAVSLFAVMMTLTFAPKIATVIDVVMRAQYRRDFGGVTRFSLGVVIETMFSMLLSPVMAIAHTVFLGSLLVGRTVGWTAQQRDDHAVPFGFAARKLWLQSVLGVALMAWFAHAMPGALYLSLPFWGSLLAAIPFAMLTAHPVLGLGLVRSGLCRIPEETNVPPALAELRLPALDLAAAPDALVEMAPEGAGTEG
jgi:membrane glycosyltransferase